MKINLFRFWKREDEQKEIKRVLHQIWCMNQKGATLPAFCDSEFQQAYNYVKRKYGLKTLKEILDI